MKSSSSRRQTNTQVLSLATIEQARAALQTLSQTPRDRFTLREAIAQLESSIQGAFRKGYSRLDVVTLLNQVGIPVSLPSLRYYLTGSPSSSLASEELDKKQATSSSSRSVPKADAKTPASLVAALQAPRSPANRQHVEDVIAYLLEE